MIILLVIKGVIAYNPKYDVVLVDETHRAPWRAIAGSINDDKCGVSFCTEKAVAVAYCKDHKTMEQRKKSLFKQISIWQPENSEL